MDNQRPSQNENPDHSWGVNEAQLDILGQRCENKSQTVWEKLKTELW